MENRCVSWGAMNYAFGGASKWRVCIFVSHSRIKGPDTWVRDDQMVMNIASEQEAISIATQISRTKGIDLCYRVIHGYPVDGTIILSSEGTIDPVYQQQCQYMIFATNQNRPLMEAKS